MKKSAILGFTGILLAGCYIAPPLYAPPYPYGYSYYRPYTYGPPRPYQPYWPGDHHDQPVPRTYESQGGPQPDAYAPQSYPPLDPDGVVRSPDQEDVIGGDETPADRSSRHVSSRPTVERHRDHIGDYKLDEKNQ